MKRREFMRTAGGSAAAATGVAAASGTAAAQEEEPDWGPDFDGYNVGSTLDARGQDEVTVLVGAGGDGLAFDPTGLWVDPGTTIVFEWTGDGGDHNVVAKEGPATGDLDSGDPTAEEGHTYEFEVSEDHEGITHYVCEPHDAVDMWGAIAVGDVETVEIVADGAWPENIGDVGVPLQKHYVGMVTFFGIALTFVFTFYVLKYGESPNTGRGN